MNAKQRTITLLILVLCLLVSGCGQGQLFGPTVTPTTTFTSTPTITPTPTKTPTPTITPTIEPTLALGEVEKVGAGGFSFQTTSGFQAQIREAQATISNLDGTILISLASAPQKNSTQSLQTVLGNFLSNVAQDVGDFKSSQPETTSVDGIDGLTVGVTGILFGEEITGKIIVAGPERSRFFFAFGLAVNGANGKRWETQGSKVFEAVLGSVKFFEPESSTSSCTISNDPTFGYTRENPIKVGGGDFGGPPRERAYLDNLLGPKGETISYDRAGSIAFGDTILDIYEIKGLQKPITLYIDEYSYTEPQAPVGFTCVSAFPLTKP
jgi:hypothetical protein